MEQRSRRIGLKVLEEDAEEQVTPKIPDKVQEKVIEKTEISKPEKKRGESGPANKFWCRKCLSFKAKLEFMESYDKFLDANGYLSICTDCINEMYRKIYTNEKSVDRTILKLCRMLNVVYRPEGIDVMRKELENRGTDIETYESVFGSYKKTLVKFHTGHTWVKAEGEEYLFVEPSVKEKLSIADTGFENEQYFQDFWGIGMTAEDYKYLEQEFGRWKQSTKCETQNEIVLVKEICHKQNEIRKARIEGKSVDTLVKSLQEIMKNSALTPALQNAAMTGKNMETFGMWVKEIEEMEPAEWLEGEGHDMYRDVADVEGYFQKYFVRPLRNFILQSKDFNIEDDIDNPEEFEAEEE